MPTYEYECLVCKKKIALQRSMKDTLAPMCFNEGCNEEEMQRIISATSFSLKGGGWAKDGYAKEKK